MNWRGQLVKEVCENRMYTNDCSGIDECFTPYLEAKLDKVMTVIDEESPYTEKIFTEPTKEEWKSFHKICIKNKLKADRFSGSCCRIGYNTVMRKLKQAIMEVVE